MISTSALIEKFQYAVDVKGGYQWGTAGVLWTEAKQKQRVSYMVNKYGADWKKTGKGDNYYYAALYGSKWIGHYVWDCSGLFAWAFKELGGNIAHGSNSIYDRYCSAKGKLSGGKRTDGKDLLPGTAVFTGSASDHGHIGLYIGGGKVIEAQGTQAGVVVSDVTLKKWTYWGELKGVDYSGTETPSQPDPAPEDPKNDEKPTLRNGDRGEWVTLAQTKLINKGYSCGTTGADGIFGKNTESAVKQFQTDSGLLADGIIGAKTWAALESEPVLYTVTIPNLSKIHAQALVNNYPGATMEERGN